ncbi:MAG TPA: UDP-N-acetylmuramoyl-L-alanyl-D-glutamate--2,6-diaminopimelate ligase [Patescibacteria group bacterium]|nr:UDP-N-acetylmuramoyl-L-alanyl-D-glutamate--2,6-diaminopimelate ligase [Patescibacteria group bacterium]
MLRKIKNIYHLCLAILANALYGWPSRKLKVIGVTGTDGKTTTVYLIYHLLKSAGFKVSMVSSIGATINDKIYDTGFHVTTPSSFSLQRLFKEAKKHNVDYFVLEVTSHALDQNRVWGVPFKIGVLTNVTNEHLDYHKTYEDYLKTKKKLLRTALTGVVNKDDGSYTYLSDLEKKKGLKNWIAYKMPLDIKFSSEKLSSGFNKYNASAAIAVCRFLKIKDADIKKGLESFVLPPGRMDFVYTKEFKIMIDFAHTPNAFLQLLSFLRPLTGGRIIHVFSSAGERDKTKRPEMGKISSDFANIIILTSEDSRRESTEKINEEIMKGIKNPVTQILKITDRQKAIDKAIELAEAEDLVLLTGKAHEKSMNLGHGEEPWDEYEAVKKALEKRGLSYE